MIEYKICNLLNLKCQKHGFKCIDSRPYNLLTINNTWSYHVTGLTTVKNLHNNTNYVNSVPGVSKRS